MKQGLVPFSKFYCAASLVAFGFIFATPALSQSPPEDYPVPPRVPINIGEEDDGQVVEATSKPDGPIDLLAEQRARDNKVQEMTAEEALATADQAYGPRKPKPCPKSTDPNEIVVCAVVQDDSEFYFSGSAENARKRYAEETAFKDAPQAPNFLPTCHSMGNPAGCVKVGRVPPPVILIDLSEIPEAPAGSDADRVANGELRVD